MSCPGICLSQPSAGALRVGRGKYDRPPPPAATTVPFRGNVATSLRATCSAVGMAAPHEVLRPLLLLGRFRDDDSWYAASLSAEGDVRTAVVNHRGSGLPLVGCRGGESRLDPDRFASTIVDLLHPFPRLRLHRPAMLATGPERGAYSRRARFRREPQPVRQRAAPIGRIVESVSIALLAASIVRAAAASHGLGQHQPTIRKCASDRATMLRSSELAPVPIGRPGASGAGGAG